MSIAQVGGGEKGGVKREDKLWARGFCSNLRCMDGRTGGAGGRREGNASVVSLCKNRGGRVCYSRREKLISACGGARPSMGLILQPIENPTRRPRPP